MYGWLRQRHDQIAEMMAEKPAPSWTVMAEQLARIGLTNRDGGVPKADAVRKVWQRVVADEAAAKARREAAKAQTESTDAGQGEVVTKRRRYGPAPGPKEAPSGPEPTMPEAVQHPSGIPPLERLHALAAQRAAGNRAGRPIRPLKTLVPGALGASPAGDSDAGQGSGMTLERPAMPRPKLVHKQGETDDGS